MQPAGLATDADGVTRSSAKTVVMALVVLVTIAVSAMMALTPADGSQPGSMSGHDMSGTSGHDMSGMSDHDTSGTSTRGH